ncbi:TPA: hypothetical protein SG801_001709, partial [Campylobacter coli]|nr:hypothetical protein [Campylobacter coli]
MAKFNFDHNQKITKNYWLDKMIKLQIKDFAFVCDGMIDFKYLKSIKLKFHGFGYGEDHYFGLVCFLKLNNIYIIKQQLHNYRVRCNSSCNFDKKITKENIPTYCLYLYDLFNQDASLTKQYIKIFSICRLIHNYIDIQNELSDEKIKYLLNQIIEYKIATNEFFIYIFYQDPLQVRTIINENLSYLINKNKDIVEKTKEKTILFQN